MSKIDKSTFIAKSQSILKEMKVSSSKESLEKIFSELYSITKPFISIEEELKKGLSTEFISFLKKENNDPKTIENLYVHNELKESGLLIETNSFDDLLKQILMLSPDNIVSYHKNIITLISHLPTSIQIKFIKSIKKQLGTDMFNSVFDKEEVLAPLNTLISLAKVRDTDRRLEQGRAVKHLLLDKVEKIINTSHFHFDISSNSLQPLIKHVSKKNWHLSSSFMPVEEEFKFILNSGIECGEYIQYVDENFNTLNWDLDFLWRMRMFWVIDALKHRLDQDKIKQMNLFDLILKKAPISLIEYSIRLGNSWKESQERALTENEGKVIKSRMRDPFKNFGGLKPKVTAEKMFEARMRFDMSVGHGKGRIPYKIIAEASSVNYVSKLKDKNLLQCSGADFFKKYIFTAKEYFGNPKMDFNNEKIIKEILTAPSEVLSG